MGSGASVVDPGEIETSEAELNISEHITNFEKNELAPQGSINILSKESSRHKLDRSSDGAIMKSKPKEKDLAFDVRRSRSVSSPLKRNVSELEHSGGEGTGTEKFSIFEEPVIDQELLALTSMSARSKSSSNIRTANLDFKKHVSRNILTGEIQGNLLQAQFSMASPVNHAAQHNEYLLQKSAVHVFDGDKLHATKPSELRQSMQQKLSDQLHVPSQSTSSLETLPALQEIRNKRKSGLDIRASLPNFSMATLSSMGAKSTDYPTS